MENNQIAEKLTFLVEENPREEKVKVMSEIASYIGELQGEVMAYRNKFKELVEGNKGGV